MVMIAIFFIVDRYFKSLALNQPLNSAKRIIGDIFLFNFTANYNISFSLPLSGIVLNIAILLIIAILIYTIFYLIINKNGYGAEIILLTFILFGAISNILDRFLFGYVVDYLELKYFTVFNLADIMIVAGAIILIIKNSNIINLKLKGTMTTDFSENLTFVYGAVKKIIADLNNGKKIEPSREDAVQLIILHDLAEIIKKAKTNNVFDEILLEKIMIDEYRIKAKEKNFTAFYNFRRVLEDEKFVSHLKTLLLN